MLWENDYDEETISDKISSLVDAWKDDRFKVFVLRAKNSPSEIRNFIEDKLTSLGTPFHLAEDVGQGGRESQRNGELWFEVRYDPKHPDAYRHSANAQPLHTDGSYIPKFPNASLLVCVTNSGEGGETIFLDSEDLVDCLGAEAPELLNAVRSDDLPHVRSGDRRTEKIVEAKNGKHFVNWNYYCVDPDIDAQGRALAEKFFQFHENSSALKEKILPVKLGPGDLVIWKDREVLHGRNGFKATQESERFIWKCAIDIGNFDASSDGF